MPRFRASLPNEVGQVSRRKAAQRLGIVGLEQVCIIATFSGLMTPRFLCRVSYPELHEANR
jgi:hypothetical protein